MSSVPGSGTPGSSAAGAVGGQVTPGIPDSQKTPSSSPPTNPTPSPPPSESTPKETPLPPQYDEKAYQAALSSYNQKQQTIQSLNEQLAKVTPQPVYANVATPKGYFKNIVGYQYSDNTPATPNDQRAIQAQELQMQIKGIQSTLGSAPTLESFGNPEYAKAKSYQDLPAGAKQYHAYVINNKGEYQETGTGNEYQDALVKAADLGINIKLDESTLVNSKGVDLRGAQGVQSYIASLVNQISVYGKPMTYDSGGGLISFNYHPETKTLEVKGTNELAINRENATRVGLPGGGLSGGGPETSQSKAYESSGVSFGQSVVAPGSLSRGPNDTISQTTKDIAAALASKDVSSGIAPKGDTYGGLASFGGVGSSNPIESPGPVINPVKENKLAVPPSPTGGIVQIKPNEDNVITFETIPTFQNVLSTKEKAKGTPSQVEFKDLNPGLQSIVSGGLGGNETSVGGIQEFLKTHDYSKLTGQLPTEETKTNIPSVNEFLNTPKGQEALLEYAKTNADNSLIGFENKLIEYQNNLKKQKQDQALADYGKAQADNALVGFYNKLVDYQNNIAQTQNQLSQQQNINAKVENAMNKLAFEGDLITSARNAGAKTIDVFGVETNIASVFPAKGKTATSFDVFGAESSKLVPLESIPVSKASELLPSILNKYQGKEIQLGYTPAPIASPGPGATLEYKIDPFEAAVGTPLSNAVVAAEGIGGVFINTGVSLYALAASYPERLSNLITGKTNNNLPPQDVLGNLGTLITPHEQAIEQKNQVPSVDVIKGTEGLFTGKGLSGFESGKGLLYDIPYIATDVSTLLIGSGIKASSLIPQIAKNAIGQEARSAAIIYSGKGSNVFVKGTAEAEQETGITLTSETKLSELPTYKNLNVMRTPVPKDVFALDTATIVSASERPITPVNLTLENTAKEISQLSRIQNDLLKASENVKGTGSSLDALYRNTVPMSSLGSTNKISNNITKVNVNDLLPHGIITPEELASGIAPIKNTTKTPVIEPAITPLSPPTIISPTSASSGNLPGFGVPGYNVAGAVGGESGPGLPDVFQAPRYSRIEFERRMAQRANPDLFESNFVPISNEIIPVSLRGTEIGQRLEALDLFNRGLKAKQNPSYYQREGVPKELMGKFSKIVSSQTVGARPEIFGQNQEVKLKIEDIEYNPASTFKPNLRTGRSPFDIQFGETPLYSNKELTSGLLSPEEQALTERYPLMKNTLPSEPKLFTEPRSIPETGKAPIQKETFDINEIYKGREEAKFFGTFELQTDFEEIGYVPKNEKPFYFKGTEAGQRIESLDLFKKGIEAKLNPDYYERIGVPKELMGKFSKKISEQTTGNKLPEIFGEKEKNIVKESNLDAFYSPSQNIRQFFERLESNNGIGKNKTKINTNAVLGIETEAPSIGEAKERLSRIEQAGLKRTERENKLIKAPQKNEEVIYSNARTFFENEMNMFSETRIYLGKGEGKLIPKGGGLASILKNFGKPSNPSPKTEEPKPRETRSQGGLIQILKEQTQQKAPFKEYPLSLGEGLVKLPKKTRKITENLSGLATASIQELEQKQKQSSSLIYKPLQSFKQAQDLLYKPAQKQGQPQAFKFMQAQEESLALAQLYKPIQIEQQKQKQPQLTKQLEVNPFEVPPPQKERQLEGTPTPVKVPTEQPPKFPGGGIFDEHKRKHPKKKKVKAVLANFIGNVPEFDIVGVYKRNEITYGNSAISRLTSQDTSNQNKKYSEKYQTGKEKTLFTNGGKTIKVKGSTAKPKSFQEKFKKKLKI